MTKKEIIIVTAGIVLLGIVIQGVCFFKASKGVSSLTRPEVGADELEITVAGKGDGKTAEITFSLEGRMPNEDEVKELLEEAKEEAKEVFLGKNESFDEIRSKVVIKEEYVEGLVTAQWEFEPSEIILSDGTLNYDGVSEDTPVGCRLVLSAYERELEDHFWVVVKKPDPSSEDGFYYFLTKAVKEADKNSATKSEVYLPTQVEDMEIRWETPISFKGFQICLVGLMGGIGIFVGKKVENRKKQEERKKEYVKDYPDIVSALVLYMGAGMSVQNAFLHIGESYKSEKKETKKERAAYEKILVLNRGLADKRDGLAVFEDFGKACHHPAYKKLSLLLIQNMKKGNSQLLNQLEQEETNLYETRLRKAKSVGEEASTKLLLPLGGLLIMVMIVTVVPALMAVRI